MGFLVALGAFNQPALADGISGLYLGASAGLAKINYDNSAFQTQLQNDVVGLGTLDFTSAELHDRKTAWRANAGCMAWPFVGIDASYLHLGELYNQVNGTAVANGGTANRSSLLAGLGVSYVFEGHWSARIDYLRIEHAGDSATGKYNAGVLAVGASYTF
jgi:hypothetical protein